MASIERISFLKYSYDLIRWNEVIFIYKIILKYYQETRNIAYRFINVTKLKKTAL